MPISCFFRLDVNFLIINCAICLISALESGKNMIFSSILLRNSGLRFSLSRSKTSILVVSMMSALCLSPRASKSSKFSRMISEPILEVMMIMVFLKLATRPLLSVNRPSSKTWSKILKVSGWAFSISSNKMMLYGLLLTASVNWPPSSYPT